MRFKNYITEEGGFKYNISRISLKEAQEYAEGEFKKAGKSLYTVLPDFDKNYTSLQAQMKKALDIPRIKMPVIEPEDMKKFDGDLEKGRVDIFKPLTGDKEKWSPEAWKPMTPKQGENWITLGIKDGNPTDDIVKANWTQIPGKKLLPLQSQIWLEKLIGNIAKFGPPKAGSPVLSTTIIASKEYYILDGHHRYGQVMLADPNLKMKALHIPLDIQLLLKITRTYGAAIGNKPKG